MSTFDEMRKRAERPPWTLDQQELQKDVKQLLVIVEGDRKNLRFNVGAERAYANESNLHEDHMELVVEELERNGADRHTLCDLVDMVHKQGYIDGFNAALRYVQRQLDEWRII